MAVLKNVFKIKMLSSKTRLALKVLTIINNDCGETVRSFLINKNLCFYYWLRKRIGKRYAFAIANTFEKVILVLGRERI